MSSFSAPLDELEEQSSSQASSAPRYAKPGPYVTKLPPDQESNFQSWVKQNKVPWQDTPDADYDMRGYYKAMQSGDGSAKQKQSDFDGKMHFPDTYKTPYHKTFSNESMYATEDAPHWQGERLVDKSGKVVADETPAQPASSAPLDDLDAAPAPPPVSTVPRSNLDPIARAQSQDHWSPAFSDVVGTAYTKPDMETRAAVARNTSPQTAASKAAGMPLADVAGKPRDPQLDVPTEYNPKTGMPFKPSLVPDLDAPGFVPGAAIPRLIEKTVGGLEDTGEAFTPQYNPQTGKYERTPAGDEAKKRQMYQGASDIISGTGGIAMQTAPLAIANKPVTTLGSIVLGSAASEGAGAVAHKMHASPEAEELARNLAFFLPSVAGTVAGLKTGKIETDQGTFRAASALGGRVRAGVATTPDVISGRVRFGGTQAEINIPRSAPAVPEPSEAAKALMDFERHTGNPDFQPAPPPPVSPGTNGPEHLTPDVVKTVSDAIIQAPEKSRASLMTEAHGNMVKWMMGRNTFVGPDQKIHTVENEGQAKKLASQFINDEVDRRDEQQEKQKKDNEEIEAELDKSPWSENDLWARYGVPPREIPQLEKDGLLKRDTSQGDEHEFYYRIRSGDWNALNARIEQLKVERRANNVAPGSGPVINPTTEAPISGKPPADKNLTTNTAAVQKVAAEANIHPEQQPAILVKKEPPKETAALAKPPEPVTPEDVKPIGKEDKQSERTILQPSDDVMQNERLAAQAAPELATKLSHIAAGVEGATFDRLRPQKELERVDEKVDDAGKPPETVPDYLAAQIAADTPKAKDRLIAELNKHFKVVKVEDNFLEGKPELANYRSANVQVQMGNNSTAEVQIVPRELQEIANESHVFYTAGREAGLRGDKAEQKKQFAKAAEMHDAAMEKFNQRNGIKPKTQHEFSSTQINVDPQSELGQAHAKAVAAIPKEHVGKEGLEKTPHITIRYGLKDDSPQAIEKIKQAAAGIEPFEVPVGKTDIFPATEHSSYDHPVIARLETTPELKSLRTAVEGAGAFKEDNFPEYKPHITLGYIKPEFAQQYKGGGQLEGQRVPVKEITVSKRDGSQEAIPLGGQPQSHSAPLDELDGQPERRINPVERKRVADMSPEEKDRELLTSDKTGLPNYRAFKEDEGQFPHVGYADVDDFKPFNTILGKVAVDAHVLPAIGEAFKRAIAKEPSGSIKAYHRSGDEFLFRTKDKGAVTRVIGRVNQELSEAVFTAEAPDGKIHEKKGAGLSHGTGESESAAEYDAEKGTHPGSKQQRKKAGLRSGTRDLPERVGEESAEGEQTEVSQTTHSAPLDEIEDSVPDVRKSEPQPEEPRKEIFPPPPKEWFGDSKIVDRDGNPLVVYHGSNRQFERFERKESYRHIDNRPQALTSPAFFFSTDEDTAMVFAEDRAKISERLRKEEPGTPEVRPYYLRAEQPLDLTNGGDLREFSGLIGYKPEDWEEIQRALDDNKVAETLKDYGYDAVKLRENDGSESWAVFNPEQIRSARAQSPTAQPAIAQFDEAVKQTGAEVKEGKPSEAFAEKIKEATHLEPANNAELKEKFTGAAYQREYFKAALGEAKAAWIAVPGSDVEMFEFLAKSNTQYSREEFPAPDKIKTDQLYIKVPGDGHFLVNNTPFAIEKALKGATRGFAAPRATFNPEAKAKKFSVPKATPEAIEKYRKELADELRSAEGDKSYAESRLKDDKESREKHAQLTDDLNKELKALRAKTNGEQEKVVRQEYQDRLRRLPRQMSDDEIEEAHDTIAQREADIPVLRQNVKDFEEQFPSNATVSKIHDTTGFEPGSMRASVFGADVLAKQAVSFYQQDIAPTLKDAAGGLKEVVTKGLRLVAPRVGVQPHLLDTIMRMKGEREEELFRFQRTTAAMKKMFDKLPEQARIAFIDNMMHGQRQPSTELEDVADAIRQIQERFRSQEKVFKPGLTDKENYFHLKWTKLPQGVDEEGNLIEGTGGDKPLTGQGNRPLQGGRSFMKRKTLPDASAGIDRGGQLLTTNPIGLLEHRVMESLKLTTARKMWEELKDTPYTVNQRGRIMHMVNFFREGQGQLARGLGYEQLKDNIAKVLFPAGSGEGMIHPGEYWVEQNAARLLNNFLSRDWFRQNKDGTPRKAGLGLIGLKNATTAWRLAFSPFHALTESIITTGSEIGRGIEHAFNQGLRHGSPTEVARGIATAAKAPVAPFAAAREGGSAIRYVSSPSGFLATTRGQSFIKQYPEAADMVSDLFTGGAKLAMHEDFRMKMVESMRQAIADNNYIGALLRTPGAFSQAIQYPLFEVYIPRLKLGMFLREYSEALNDRQPEIDAGKLTRAKLARETWDNIDYRFGEVNWDNFFFNRTFKTSLQLAFRAFAWRFGNFAFTGSGVTGQARQVAESLKFLKDAATGGDSARPGTNAIPKVDPRMAKLLGLVVFGVIAHSLLQYALTKEKPKDEKDLIAPRDGTMDAHGHPNRWTLPIVPFRDLESMRANPSGYIRGGMADIWTAIPEAINNRDFRNHLVSHPSDPYWEQMFDKAAHVVGMPIGVDRYRQEKKRGEGTGTALLGELGLSRATNYELSPAEKKMREIQIAHYGPETDQDLEEREKKQERIAAGHLTPDERRKKIQDILKNSFEKGMRSFTYEQAKQVYDVASPEEKAMMGRTMLQKRFNSRRTVAGGE